jgi:hypothetical protein
MRSVLALAAVIAGIAVFTLAVQGVTRVDARLEVAAAAKRAAPAKLADCAPGHRAPGDRARGDRARV